MKREMELKVNVHLEDGSYWADVPELPGCFAAGDSLDELMDSLSEGIDLYLSDGDQPSGGRVSTRPLRLTAAVLSDAVPA
jgi:predicted RNase H-like HicB family nuclease